MAQQLGEQSLRDHPEVQLTAPGAAQHALCDGLFGQLPERFDEPGADQVLPPGPP